MRKVLIKVVGWLERLTGKLNSRMSVLEYNLTFPVRARSHRWMKKNYKKLLEKYGECTLVIHDREVVGVIDGLLYVNDMMYHDIIFEEYERYEKMYGDDNLILESLYEDRDKYFKVDYEEDHN